MGYKIAQFAKLTGISAHTLRYYEKEGLITPLRNLQGYREYRDNDLAWIEFIQRLKATNMPLKLIKEYAKLRSQGDTTLPQCYDMLSNHEIQLEQTIQDLQNHLKALKTKKQIYREQMNAIF